MSSRAVAVSDPQLAARELRAGIESNVSDITSDVAAIVDAVKTRGDAAVREFAERFDGLAPQAPLRVDASELSQALAALDPAVRSGLEQAAENITAVAEATLGDSRELELGPGQRVSVREVPVARAAIYAPGGRNPYPSTVLMGALTAKAAGVGEIAVCVPGGHEVMLAACELCGVDEVWRFGGAHAVAALAFGTQTVDRVDVIAGPGNAYVQEAKRLLAGREVGIDGFAGPSDLLVLAGANAPVAEVCADLLAQAEHGAGSIVGLVTDSGEYATACLGVLDGNDVGRTISVFVVPDARAALSFTQEFAPEHLQLVGQPMEALAPEITRAGCVFVGASTGVAFGDYIAGSNHTLPTEGAARFASVLSARTFRRLQSEVRLDAAAASRLAAQAVPIAEAEGFTLHAESMRVRQNQE